LQGGSPAFCESAQRIGEATAPSVSSYGKKFIVREKLESGLVTWQFYRRSFDKLE
jgi:hypothetical protein